MIHARYIFMIIILLQSATSYGDVRISLLTNLETSTDTRLTTSQKKSDRLYDGSILVQLQKEGSLYLVLGYLAISSAAPISTTGSSLLASQNPYYGFMYSFYGKFCTIGIYTSQQVRATYSETQSETWSGSAYYGKLGIHPQITESFSLEISLAYYYASFDSKSSASSVSSVSSFTQTVTAPMIGFQYSF